MVLDDSIEGVNIVLTKGNSITFGAGLVACKIYPDVFRGILGRPVRVETKLLGLERVASSNHSTVEAFRQFQSPI